MKNLQQRILDFDYFYEMRDDHRRYEESEKEHKELRAQLSQLSESEYQDIKSKTNGTHFDRYFALPEFEGEAVSDNEPQTNEPPSLRSRVFSLAWALYKGGYFEYFNTALRQAWNVTRVFQRLQAGVAYFSYQKSNGETRQAIGTLNPVNFQYQYKGNSNKRPDVIQYWDLESRGWRSFRAERLR